MSPINTSLSPRYWAIVPAAGVGSRMGAMQPKQYIIIHGKPLVVYSVNALLASPQVHAVVVVVAEHDEQWGDCQVEDPSRVRVTTGGATRAESVYQGLLSIQSQAQDDDWVLVHDAARPFLSMTVLQRLMDELQGNPCGGLLAIPVTDTLKKANSDGRVVETVSRDLLWRAQTPQMFRYSVLVRAMKSVLECPDRITDEASAVECLGLQPRLVLGDERNFKVTYPGDIDRMFFLLKGEETL